MRAESIKIYGDEDGFHLIIQTEQGYDGFCSGRFDFNIHACAPELFEQVKRQIGEWLAEGEAVRHLPASAVFAKPYDQDEDAYDLSNPKHPRFHSVHADLWDTFREGK